MTIRPLRAGEFSIITKHIFIMWMIQKKEFKIVFRWGQVYVCVCVYSFKFHVMFFSLLLEQSHRRERVMTKNKVLLSFFWTMYRRTEILRNSARGMHSVQFWHFFFVKKFTLQTRGAQFSSLYLADPVKKSEKVLLYNLCVIMSLKTGRKIISFRTLCNVYSIRKNYRVLC